MGNNSNARCSWSARTRYTRWVAFFVLLVGVPSYAQSLGDIAREEQKRKEGQPRQTTHVYDNDDLARPQILVPEDRERVLASKKKTNPASVESPIDADVSTQKSAPKKDELPGDVVRLAPSSEKDSPQPGPAPMPVRPVLKAPSETNVAAVRSPVNTDTPARKSEQRIGKSIDHGHRAPAETIQTKLARNETPDASRRVRIQAGDSLWKLAAKYLGRGEDWLVLVGRNPQLNDPLHLQVGMWVRLPDKPPGRQATQLVRIKHGDSLWTLTQHYLGDGRAWGCVARANPQLRNSSLIVPGEILKFPERCGQRLLSSSLRTRLQNRPFPLSNDRARY
jgi:nucleoid-associated protein YgaU